MIFFSGFFYCYRVFFFSYLRSSLFYCLSSCCMLLPDRGGTARFGSLCLLSSWKRAGVGFISLFSPFLGGYRSLLSLDDLLLLIWCGKWGDWAPSSYESFLPTVYLTASYLFGWKLSCRFRIGWESCVRDLLLIAASSALGSMYLVSPKYLQVC